MFMHESQLWSKLEAYSPDNPNDALTFSKRLARENGWSPHLTERVINEYKKFLFLCTISPHPVTPSDEVDQAWHLHLVYTKSYWNDLCRDILQKDLHHTPTEGGLAERQKFFDLYEATLQLYRDHFGEPPWDIWPSAHRRFANNNFVRIDTSTNYIIGKKGMNRKIAAALLIALGLATSLLWWNWGSLFIAVLVTALLMQGLDKHKAYKAGCSSVSGCGGCGTDSGGSADSGCSGDGGCSGGCGGCGGGD